MKLHTCPVCDEVYPHVRTLAAHVLDAHLPWGECWCGWNMSPSGRWVGRYEQAANLRAHVGRHGGFTAHYHAVLLGID